MTHRFVSQPYEDGLSLMASFGLFGDLGAPVQLDVVVAWAKRTGLLTLKTELQSLRDSGGFLRAIIGISQGGTSRQALELAVEMFDEAWVFHVPGRTFHPKVYLARGANGARSLVGSHNLTAGGAQNNFEAGVFSDLDLSNPADAEYVDQITEFVQRLLGDSDVCVQLNADSLAEICERFWLSDEDAEQAAWTSQARGANPLDEPSGSLFTSSKHKLRTIPGGGRPSRKAKSSEGVSGDGQDRTGKPTRTPIGATATPRPAVLPAPPSTNAATGVVRRWFKELHAIDAQQPGRGNASNTMTLVQGGHDIDHRRYFRYDFFGDETWVATTTKGGGKKREVAHITMEVVVDGTSHGLHSFDVRHTPDYESDQNNRLTELRWGSFASYMKAHDMTGRYATLEKLTAGYRLTIEASPTGQFIK